MSRNFNLNTDNKDEWLTPPFILQALGPFDLDPCAPVNRPWPMASKHYTIEDNGLSHRWYGRIWLNPPYGKQTFQWLERLSEHKNGLALIFARTETLGFHQFIWDRAHTVFFFKGRLCFHYITGERGGTANAPSCLISYSAADTRILRKAVQDGRITGKLLKCREEKKA